MVREGVSVHPLFKHPPQNPVHWGSVQPACQLRLTSIMHVSLHSVSASLPAAKVWKWLGGFLASQQRRSVCAGDGASPCSPPPYTCVTAFHPVHTLCKLCHSRVSCLPFGGAGRVWKPVTWFSYNFSLRLRHSHICLALRSIPPATTSLPNL